MSGALLWNVTVVQAIQNVCAERPAITAMLLETYRPSSQSTKPQRTAGKKTAATSSDRAIAGKV